MPFSLATWNINSVRLRMPIVERFLRAYQPDVLCLQEIKVPDELFPTEAFHAIGYEHVTFHGQKGYHGVATVARHKIDIEEKRNFCDMGDTRHMSTRIEIAGKSILLHNFYVPAGGDEPDPAKNPKFRHKLDFVQEMHCMQALAGENTASILVGDLNIAPLDNDVWSHKQMLKVVSHTPVETQGLEGMRQACGWEDLMRHHIPADQKLYTWWSYRSANWQVADKGRRLDHVWGSANLKPLLTDIEVVRDARGWDRPSDHVPVIARFALDV